MKEATAQSTIVLLCGFEQTQEKPQNSFELIYLRYHKVAWIVQSMAFNGAVFCFIGAVTYEIALVRGDMPTTVLLEAFTR